MRIQNPRNPFPAWRLPKRINKFRDEELEKSIESCERWGWFGGGLVILGVAATVTIAVIHPQYDSLLEQWGSAIADILVAVGVAIEIIFGRMAGLRQNELKRRSDEKVAEVIARAAEANERAAEADLARVRLEAQLAPRELTKEQCEKLLTLKERVSDVNVTSMPDFESISFARQITQALLNAGIRAELCAPRIGMVWSGLYVVVPEPIPYFGADPLYLALKEAGLSVGCGDRTKTPMADLSAKIPVIMVGEKKPLAQGRPPYVFTLPSKTDEAR